MIKNLMIGSGTFSTSRYNVKTDKLNVFISDDSPVVRVRLANMIADINGVSLVGEAANVQDSIEKINQIRPNAVILDICMPGGSGIDVLKKVRELNSSAIIIVLTNYPFPQYRKICMEAGADYFFDKSNEFHKVLDIFKNMAAHQD